MPSKWQLIHCYHFLSQVDLVRIEEKEEVDKVGAEEDNCMPKGNQEQNEIGPNSELEPANGIHPYKILNYGMYDNVTVSQPSLSESCSTLVPDTLQLK